MKQKESTEIIIHAFHLRLANKVFGCLKKLKKVWLGVCRRGLQTLTPFKIKSVHFATLLKKRSVYILLVFYGFCLACFLFPYSYIKRIFFYE